MEKLFSSTEIKIIQNSDKPLQTFWVLWFVKESSYKAWQRNCTKEPVFNPIMFQIANFEKTENHVNSTVVFDEFSVPVKTEIRSEYIYSYCNSLPIFNRVISIKERRSINDKLVGRNWLLTKKEFNIPEIEHIKSKEKRPVSISHDGRFVAINY